VRLVRLQLRNYRNYRQLDLDLGSRLNLFLGANGQGKTNLLESIALLALSVSPRARREVELIGPLGPEARVQAAVEGGGRERELQIDLREEAGRVRKRILVDGVPRRAFDLPGIARATLFWPEDLNLVKAGPEHRRRFLNQMLVQVEAGYARLLGRYARTLEQRNHLLKQIAAGESGMGTLAAWDEELVAGASEIVAARTGELPILLLDDVLSELDPERRAALLARVAAAGQVVVTSAEPAPLPPELMHSARVSCIQAGEVGACG